MRIIVGFKMRRDDVRGRIVRGVLDRAEVRHVHVLGNDHEAARVLAGGALDPDQALGKPVLLRLGGGDVPLFQVLLHVAVGRFLRKRPDRPGAEDVVRAEEHFGVLVGAGLVLAGEVQVDIRRLLVAGVAEEGFEGDVKAVTAQDRPAEGTALFRHIRAAAVR